jgi:hypothetical protein
VPKNTDAAAPEPVRDHFVTGAAGLMTAEEAADWWAAHPPDPSPPAEADQSPEAPQDAGPSDSQEN